MTIVVRIRTQGITRAIVSLLSFYTLLAEKKIIQSVFEHKTEYVPSERKRKAIKLPTAWLVYFYWLLFQVKSVFSTPYSLSSKLKLFSNVF